MVTSVRNFYTMIHRKYPLVQVRAKQGIVEISEPLSAEDNVTYNVALQENGWYSVKIPQIEYKSLVSLFPINISSVDAWFGKYPFLQLANRKHFSNVRPLDILINGTEGTSLHNEKGNYYLLTIKNVTIQNTAFFNKVPHSYDAETETIMAVVKSSSNYAPQRTAVTQHLNLYNTLLLYITNNGSNEDEFNYILQQLGRSHLTKDLLFEAFKEGKFFEVMAQTQQSLESEPF